MAKSMVQVARLSYRLPSIKRQATDRAAAVVKKTAFDIEAGAKERSRVDTGAMKNAWHTTLEGDLSATVSNNVEYVIFNEFGTAHLPPQPMLTPAVETARPDFIAAMKRILS